MTPREGRTARRTAARSFAPSTTIAPSNEGGREEGEDARGRRAEEDSIRRPPRRGPSAAAEAAVCLEEGRPRRPRGGDRAGGDRAGVFARSAVRFFLPLGGKAPRCSPVKRSNPSGAGGGVVVGVGRADLRRASMRRRCASSAASSGGAPRRVARRRGARERGRFSGASGEEEADVSRSGGAERAAAVLGRGATRGRATSGGIDARPHRGGPGRWRRAAAAKEDADGAPTPAMVADGGPPGATANGARCEKRRRVFRRRRRRNDEVAEARRDRAGRHDTAVDVTPGISLTPVGTHSATRGAAVATRLLSPPLPRCAPRAWRAFARPSGPRRPPAPPPRAASSPRPHPSVASSDASPLAPPPPRPTPGPTPPRRRSTTPRAPGAR